MSKIQWTEKTWNPTIGCSKASPGCEHCYAIKEAWIRMGNPNPKIQAKFAGTVKKTTGGSLNWTGNINLGQEALTIPLRTKGATLWFVNSMSDLFHPNMPQEYIDEIHAVMALCRQHTFQVLTKHPDVMLDYYRSGWEWRVADKLNEVYAPQGGMFELAQEVQREITKHPVTNVLPNLWLGVSVENQKYADERIPLLLLVPAAVRFLSCEPLLGAVDITKWIKVPYACNKCGFIGTEYHTEGHIEGVHAGCSYSAFPSSIRMEPLHWVIVGGESGKDARPMHPVWAQSLRNQCEAAGVAFFFKQWGEWAPQEHWKDNLIRQKCYMWEDGSTEVDVYAKAGKGGQVMGKVGKKKAGELLDFTEYKQMPRVGKIPDQSVQIPNQI